MSEVTPAALSLFTGDPTSSQSGSEETSVSSSRGGLFRQAPESIRVARGQVVVGGPEGYCIDRRASNRSGKAAFVLLASCSSLTGLPVEGAPASPGLLTASVDKTASEVPSPAEFRSFFSTSEGRAALARDGQASSVDVLESQIYNGALVMKIRDKSPVSTPGLENSYWRGLFVLNSRLITLTVNAFEVRPLGKDAGREKLAQFINRIRTLSEAE